jgi:hypothetical protein
VKTNKYFEKVHSVTTLNEICPICERKICRISAQGINWFGCECLIEEDLRDNHRKRRLYQSFEEGWAHRVKRRKSWRDIPIPTEVKGKKYLEELNKASKRKLIARGKEHPEEWDDLLDYKEDEAQFLFEGESNTDLNDRVEIPRAWLHDLPWHRSHLRRRQTQKWHR